MPDGFLRFFTVYMKATQILPSNYVQSGTFDLKNKKLMIFMNLIGLVLLIFSIWFFSWLVALLRDGSSTSITFEFSSIPSFLIAVFQLILTIVLVLVFHEAIHAFFFWIFSGEKPKVGFKGSYAFAAMPGWYFPRNQYLLIGIAPLLVVSIIGVLLMVVVPESMLNMVLVALVLNTSGAIGDLIVVVWLLAKPRHTYALDQIDSIVFYVPSTTNENV